MSNPSLLNIPYRFKAGTLYSQIPDSGLGDFVVSRSASNVATRVNASGFIETVADNVPRLDYPLGGIANGCPGLLVEPSAQNLALQSENFGTTWSSVALLAFGSGSVLNTTATLDPYGTNVADLIVANTTGGTQHRVDQTTVSSSGSYTFSVFLKAAGYDFARLRIGSPGAVFNLASGTISATDVGIVSSIQSYGNGWYRCIISKAASSANEVVRINMQPTSSTADFAGDGTSGIYVFGGQYETGSVATSYIPTTTASITRGAETISKTGVSSLIGQTEGTMYWEGAINSIDRIFLSLTSGTSNSQVVRLQTTGTGLMQLIVVSGTIQANIPTSGAITLGQFYKVAVAYKQDDFVFYLNGAQVGTDTSGTIPTALTQIQFSNAGATDLTNQRCRAVALFPTRLTNAQLQALTT
jgi:hypothetical protein